MELRNDEHEAEFMLRAGIWNILAVSIVSLLSGCNLVPDMRADPQVHNPFPQLKRVAVLPFFNQSSEPTVNQDAVAEAYYSQLQDVLGFEVLPVGLTKLKWHEYVRASGEPAGGKAFQEFARYLNVDAVVVGAVTDFTPYYPPRMAMTTHWYAANEGFHPIPTGYGLPWGTPAEKHIPHEVVLETEFELARKQLETQSPVKQSAIAQVQYEELGMMHGDGSRPDGYAADMMPGEGLPQSWPDPSGLIPDGPSATAPAMHPQHEPVLSHTRIYDAKDSNFTQRLADRFYADDDARFGGWQSYLSRSDDFIRFCCHLHITDMLSARGGKHKPDLIFRWPISRYSR